LQIPISEHSAAQSYGKGKAVPVHTTKANGGVEVSPFILNISSRVRWLFNLMPQLFCPKEEPGLPTEQEAK